MIYLNVLFLCEYAGFLYIVRLNCTLTKGMFYFKILGFWGVLASSITEGCFFFKNVTERKPNPNEC